MKKLLALVLILIISICCKPKVVEKIIEVDREVGYLLTPEKTFTASSGDNSIVELWDEYIKAHNNRDLESISEMNSDSIQIYGPHGEIIEGIDNHLSFLEGWFEGASPKWKTFFSFPMKVNSMESQKDGQWVVSGAVVKMNVDGAEIDVTQLYDVYSENGKIMKFYVYERANPSIE
jgi:hypothetical protein